MLFWMLLCVIIVFSLIAVYCEGDSSGSYSKAISTFLVVAVVLTMIFGLLCLGVGVIASHTFGYTYTITPPIEISSIDVDQKEATPFSLGTGTIDGKENYIYLIKNDNGDLVRSGYIVSDSSIFETTKPDDKPRIQFVLSKNVVPRWLGAEWIFGKTKVDKAEIFVPKGTVIKRFDVPKTFAVDLSVAK